MTRSSARTPSRPSSITPTVKAMRPPRPASGPSTTRAFAVTPRFGSRAALAPNAPLRSSLTLPTCSPATLPRMGVRPVGYASDRSSPWLSSPWWQFSGSRRGPPRRLRTTVAKSTCIRERRWSRAAAWFWRRSTVGSHRSRTSAVRSARCVSARCSIWAGRARAHSRPSISRPIRSDSACGRRRVSSW